MEGLRLGLSPRSKKKSNFLKENPLEKKKLVGEKVGVFQGTSPLTSLWKTNLFAGRAQLSFDRSRGLVRRDVIGQHDTRCARKESLGPIRREFAELATTGKDRQLHPTQDQ